MLNSFKRKYYRVPILVVVFTFILCSRAVHAEGKPEPLFGNCLSMPVIWSDGVSKVLRGTYESPVFGGGYYVHPDSGNTLYLQQEQDNAWQAQSADAAGNLDVDLIDWGDNLEAVDWNERSKVRVEVVLWQDISNPMTAFVMEHCYGDGQDEMWGTTTETYLSNEATVYSHCARLTIQKLTKSHLDPDDPPILTWDPDNDEWTGDVTDEVLFKSGVWNSEGPDSYSAEINVSGKCIYGYNWDVRRNSEGTGSYRITFSFENNENVTGVALNTFFTENTQIKIPEELPEELNIIAVEEGESPMGGTPYIDYLNNLTYIDINIVEKKGGNPH